MSCTLNLANNSNHEWWSLNQNKVVSPYLLPSQDDKDDFLEMIIYSTRIAPPIFSAIAGIGWVIG